MIEPTECRMVVASVDIAGFVKVSEKKTDLDQFNMLSEFYALVVNVISKTNGRVIKYLGDETLIVFPEAEAEEAIAALRELLDQAQTIWSQLDTTCRLSINAHVGPLVCGLMGPDQKFDVIGNTVNKVFLMPHTEGLHLTEELKKLVKK
jgi:adenylate cyclase